MARQPKLHLRQVRQFLANQGQLLAFSKLPLPLLFFFSRVNTRWARDPPPHRVASSPLLPGRGIWRGVSSDIEAPQYYEITQKSCHHIRDAAPIGAVLASPGYDDFPLPEEACIQPAWGSCHDCGPCKWRLCQAPASLPPLQSEISYCLGGWYSPCWQLELGIPMPLTKAKTILEISCLFMVSISDFKYLQIP